MSIGMKMHTMTKIVIISGQFKKCHMGRFTPPFVVYNNSINIQVPHMYATDRFLKIDRAPVVAASDAADELLEIFKMYPQEDGSDEYMAALCGEVVAYLNEALGVED